MKSDFYTTLIWVSQNTVTPIPVMVSAALMVPAPVIPDDTKAKCSGAGIGDGLRQENRYRHRYRWRYHLTLTINRSAVAEMFTFRGKVDAARAPPFIVQARPMGMAGKVGEQKGRERGQENYRDWRKGGP